MTGRNWKKGGPPQNQAESRSEDWEQIQLIKWVRMATTFGLKVADSEQAYEVKGWALSNCGHPIPELDLLFAIPNGGSRDVMVGALLKSTGVKAGVHDLFLPVPRHGKHGLWIEMKREDGGTMSDKQLEWRDAMWNQGYGCALCHGWKEAREVLVGYLSLS